MIYFKVWVNRFRLHFEKRNTKKKKMFYLLLICVMSFKGWILKSCLHFEKKKKYVEVAVRKLYYTFSIYCKSISQNSAMNIFTTSRFHNMSINLQQTLSSTLVPINLKLIKPDIMYLINNIFICWCDIVLWLWVISKINFILIIKSLFFYSLGFFVLLWDIRVSNHVLIHITKRAILANWQ